MNTDTFKEKLEAELKQLEETLSTHGKKSGGVWTGSSDDMDKDASDPNVVADQIEELVGNVQVVDELEKRLHAIQKALEKIANGTFGKCEVGGEDIPEDRLHANPSSETCIEHSK